MVREQVEKKPTEKRTRSDIASEKKGINKEDCQMAL
jgi:hypothetical protein